MILGEAEMAAGTVAVKYLREQREQVDIAQAEIISRLAPLLK
jgi:histidyl-tRNA synthetase